MEQSPGYLLFSQPCRRTCSCSRRRSAGRRSRQLPVGMGCCWEGPLPLAAMASDACTTADLSGVPCLHTPISKSLPSCYVQEQKGCVFGCIRHKTLRLFGPETAYFGVCDRVQLPTQGPSGSKGTPALPRCSTGVQLCPLLAQALQAFRAAGEKQSFSRT